jgi:RNA polymerase sigma-70 factor (ECF subfamily)
MGAGPVSHPTEELVRRGREGDPTAFVSLVERHRSRLQALAYTKMSRKLLEIHDVEDVLQEACLRGFQSFKTFEWRGPNSFYRWIAGIVENVIVDYARNMKAKKRDGGVISLDGDGARDGGLVPAPGPSPSSLVGREERFERLRNALDQLDEDHREVIYLARIHLLPLKEVGKRMGRSADAVSELLRRALRRLKEIFGDTGSFGLPPKSLADPPRGGGGRPASPARKASNNGQSRNGAEKGS